MLDMRDQKLKLLIGLKKLCSGAVVFGFVTSAGGNVLHAVEESFGRGVAQLTISIVIAILIPGIFGWMFEIATRIPFRKEAHWFMKTVAVLGAVFISGVTAWNSYFHQRDAFSHFGDHTQAILLPLAIDGLMIIGSVYLIELGTQIRDLEAHIAAGGVARKTVEKEPKPTTKKDTNKRERIAALLAQNPTLPIRDIARLADASYNYTHALVSELRKGNAAELLSA